jgi:hypothetical protein
MLCSPRQANANTTGSASPDRSRPTIALQHDDDDGWADFELVESLNRYIGGHDPAQPMAGRLGLMGISSDGALLDLVDTLRTPTKPKRSEYRD